jgi:hypothetical protein
MFKALKKPAQKSAFVTMLMAQQAVMGKYSHWRRAYEKKCAKKGASFPAEAG